MRRVPRRHRARGWAWLYAVLFEDDQTGTAADGQGDDDPGTDTAAESSQRSQQ